MKKIKYRSILITCMIVVFTAMPFGLSGIAASDEIDVGTYDELKNVFNEASTDSGNSYTALLTEDITIPDNINELELSGGNLTIIGNGHSIIYDENDTADSVIEVSGGTLSLGSNSTDDELIISGGNKVHEHSLVKLSQGTLYINSNAELSGNINSGIGGGIYADNGTSLYFTGGKVINNKASEAGGVYIAGSTVKTYISGAITISGNTEENGNAENLYLSGSGQTDTSSLIVNGSLSGSQIGITVEQEKKCGVLQFFVFTQGYYSYNKSLNPTTVFTEDNPGFYIQRTSSYKEVRTNYNAIDVTVPNELDIVCASGGSVAFNIEIKNNSAYNYAYITGISCNCNNGWQLMPLGDERISASIDGKLWGLQLDGIDLSSSTAAYTKRQIDKRSSVNLSGNASFGSTLYGIDKENIATITFTISNK